MTPAPAPAQTWPALGTPVTYSDDGKYGEWKRGGPYYFAGVTQLCSDKISVWIADKWPVESMGNLTDGFSPEEWGLHKVGALRSGVALDAEKLAEWLCDRYSVARDQPFKDRSFTEKRPWRQDAMDLIAAPPRRRRGCDE